MDEINFLLGLWSVLVTAAGMFGVVRFFQQKERRLFRNIQRPILVIGTKDKDMSHEYALLRRAGWFKVDPPASDRRAVDLMNGNRLVIIGYTPNSQDFRDAFEAAKKREIPVIVFAGPTRISDEDMAMLQDYSHHSMCNTPLRLISDVFAVMATYPEDK